MQSHKTDISLRQKKILQRLKSSLRNKEKLNQLEKINNVTL